MQHELNEAVSDVLRCVGGVRNTQSRAFATSFRFIKRCTSCTRPVVTNAGASMASAKDTEINTEKDGDAKQTKPAVAQRFNVNYS